MNRLAEFRERAGYTQKQIADALHVSQPSVCAWESGESQPRADKLPEIARLYGCTIDDLFKDGE